MRSYSRFGKLAASIAGIVLVGVFSTAAQEILTNQQVIDMVVAGLSETVVLQKIQTSQGQFSTTTTDLIALKKAGVPDAIIAAMVAASSKRSAGSSMSTPSPSFDSPKLFPIQRDKKWGYIDTAGKVVVPPTYDYASYPSEGPLMVTSGKRTIFIDGSGSVLFEPSYSLVRAFSEGLAAVGQKQGKENRWGFVDQGGKLVVPLRYVGAGDFSEGLAGVYEEGKGCGYIDRSGTVVIPLRLATCGPFSDGLAIAASGSRYPLGYIDRSGEFVVEPQFYYAGSYSEGLAPAAPPKTRKFGFLDKSGKWAVPPQFEGAQSFSDGLAAVKSEGKWGFVDSSGSFVIRPRFGDVKSGFMKALEAIESSTSFASGKDYRITPAAEPAQPFSDGVAAVHLGGREWGYIDRAGDVIVRLPTKSMGAPGRFDSGLAPYWEDEKLGYMDRSGTIVWKPSK